MYYTCIHNAMFPLQRASVCVHACIYTCVNAKVRASCHFCAYGCLCVSAYVFEYNAVIALDIFQTDVLFIRWRKQFMETSQIAVTGQIHSLPPILLPELY